MKKLALSVILGASLALTSSAFALTSMTADTMKAATAQAGVTIAVDGIEIESFTGTTAYIDTDGTGFGATDQTGGAIIISNRHTLKNYDALVCGLGYKTQFLNKVNSLVGTGSLADTAAVKGSIAVARGVSIDVGACPLLSTANLINGLTGASLDAVAGIIGTDGTINYTAAAGSIATATSTTATAVYGVVIGLPTLMISTTADSYTVQAARYNSATDTYDLKKDFIKISKGASVMAILGGSVEIAAH